MRVPVPAKVRHLVIVLLLGTCVWIIAVATKLYYRTPVGRPERIKELEEWEYLELPRLPKRTTKPTTEPPLPTQGLNAGTLRVVHLDLKGAPPLMSYLQEWLKLIAHAGCTALLIEYEDMFPFEGILRNVTAGNAYTKTQILDLLQLCDTLEIEVIPLIQTFGHMEYVLKLPDFMNLREVQQYPEVICPSKSDSHRVVEEMVRQVMAVHRTAKHIHIGCDEVYHLKICPVCTGTNDNPSEIFERHVIDIASFIKDEFPGVKPLIWDDMMRSWLPGYFSLSKLHHWVEPVVWIYGTDVWNTLPNWNWYWYAKTFPHIWVAGSFKGATGELSILPNITFHIENQMSWIQFLRKSTLLKPTNIKGFILTGWSRYDHFAGLCELLPPATPSLIINLDLISHSLTQSASVHKTNQYRNILAKRATHLLQCTLSAIESDQLSEVRYDQCGFLGHGTYYIMQQLMEVEPMIDAYYESFVGKNAWLTSVNEREHFMSPFRVWSRFRIEEWTAANKRAAMLEKLVRSEFVSFYDVFTIEEWFQQRIKPLYDKLDRMKHLTDTALRQTHWPRRPLVKRPFQD